MDDEHNMSGLRRRWGLAWPEPPGGATGLVRSCKSRATRYVRVNRRVVRCTAVAPPGAAIIDLDRIEHMYYDTVCTEYGQRTSKRTLHGLPCASHASQPRPGGSPL